MVSPERRPAILLVDDEPRVLAGLRRALYALGTDWQVSTANSGSEALALMADQPFDVVVSDMRMPNMTGAELLDRVRHLHPEVIRFILTGQTSQAALIAAAGPTHQVLAKPCEPRLLRQILERALRLRTVLQDAKVRAEVTGVANLPAVPRLYTEIKRALARPDTSIEAVGRLIADDPATSAKLLQVVNSPFFGMTHRVSSPARAAVLLGVEAVQALVLGLGAFEGLAAAEEAGLPVDTFFQRAVLTARLARLVARDLQVSADEEEEAYLGGLMHDVGWLVLGVSQAESLGRFFAARGDPARPPEEAFFGASHRAFGAYLMALWGIPDAVVDAVAHHHDLALAGLPEAGVLRAVLVADAVLAAQHPLPTDPVVALEIPDSLRGIMARALGHTEAVMKEAALA